MTNTICETGKICNGCSACYNACPVGAIKMERNSEGFSVPVINKDVCIDCNLCRKVCSVNQDYFQTTPETADFKKIKAYAASCKNTQIRSISSSGGVFFFLAQYIIHSGGVVYGASFDEKFNVRHERVVKEEDIYKLCGSKYVQSDICECFKQVKEDLHNEKKVLFSGTPCQIGGLYSYLGKKTENLILVDIICHGVPSPGVWEKFLEEKRVQYKSEITDISFRDKRDGWKDFGTSIRFANGEEYYDAHYKETYMKAFLLDMILRPSCYNCNYKSINRVADLTIADFWGVEKVAADSMDNNGVSLVIIHTKTGESAINSISDNFQIIEVDAEAAILNNSAMFKSVSPFIERSRYFKNWTVKPSAEYLEKSLIPSYYHRLIKKLKTFL